MSPTSSTHLTDAQLVQDFLAGDRSAFAAIYDRYADALYDTAAAMTRNRHDAADVMQDVFVLTAERLGQLRDPSRLKPWLFAIMRNEVYRRSGRKQRSVSTDFNEPVAEMQLPSEPAIDSSQAEFDELADLVRGAAAGLDERDQLVLEYSVRHGLEGDELAAALGVTPQQCYGLVHRMRQRTERSLGAFCVARKGRKECAELAEILRGWDGQFSVLIRKRVARHVDRCDTCERSRRKLAPLALFGAAPALAAPAELRDRVLGARGGGIDGTYDFEAPGGFPSAIKYGRHLGWWLLAAIVALVLSVGTIVYVMAADGPDGADAVAATDEGEEAADSADSSESSSGSDGAASPAGEDADADEGPQTDDGSAADGSAQAPAGSVPAGESSPPTVSTASATTDAPPTTQQVAASPVAAPTTGPSPATTAPAPPPPPPAPTTAPPATTTPASTTPATTTPATTTPATTTPTTPPPAPAELVVSEGMIDFGTTIDQSSVTLSNDGGVAVTWSVAGLSGAYSANRAGGTLAAGESIEIGLAIDRGWPSEGPLPAVTVAFTGDGTTAMVVLTGEIARDPNVSIVRRPDATVCTKLFGDVSVSAEIADESGPITATLIVTDPLGGTQSDVALVGSTIHTATVTPNGPEGAWNWRLSVVDAFGNTTTIGGSIDVDGSWC